MTPLDVLNNERVWSPVKKRNTLIRETPTTPTRTRKRSLPQEKACTPPDVDIQ
jgi:hypothetical protein